MTTAPSFCPSCYQPVSSEARVCPHCSSPLEQAVQSGSLSKLELVPSPDPTRSGVLPLASPTESLPDALKQLDAVATTNITISGVLIAFYASAIFAGKVIASATFNVLVYASPLLLLLGTIIFSVRVFYSAGYLTHDYAVLLRKKEKRLRLSSLLLEISVGLLAVSVFVYLVRPS